MPIVWRTDGPWGSGKGANLTPAERDNNDWFLFQLIEALEADIPDPDQISNITKSGNSITIYLTDGRSFGPFTLPTAVNETFVQSLDAATHTLSLADLGRYYRVIQNCVVTVPSFATVPIPVNSEMHFRLTSPASLLTFVAGSGALINGIEGFDKAVDIVGGVVTLKCVAASHFDLFGHLALGTGTGSTGTGTGTGT